MKLPLAVAFLLVASCSGKANYTISVHGALSCSQVFHFRITLWELDLFNHDMIGRISTLRSNDTSAMYHISAHAYDGGAESEVEPLMTIEHSCGTLSYGSNGCLCKDFGDVGADLEVKMDVDLEKPDLKYCDICEDARKL
ncbi:hypothetical protein PMAYCL1PPCAC_24706, partial [Pristionchus mayeri]